MVPLKFLKIKNLKGIFSNESIKPMNQKAALFSLLSSMLLVASLTGITSDIYTPAFLAIKHDLSTSIDQVQRSMAIFMMGVSFSQLVYGPISEGIGRRLPLLIGLSIMFIGSIVCVLSSTINFLLLGRLIQGIGAGACACLWRSIFRDSFDSTQMAKYGAYLGITMTFVVAGTPAVGGYLQEFFGWRSIFLFLIVYSLITFLIVFFLLKETSRHYHKNQLHFSFIKYACRLLLLSPTFMGYTLCTFLTYGAFFSWFVVGPVLLIDTIGMNPVTFGWMNLILGGVSMVIAGIFNGKMIGRLGKNYMLRLGWGIVFFSGLLMLFLKILNGLTVFSLIFPIFIFFFGVTLIWPNAFSGAFAPFGKVAGYAGAFYSFMQIGGGALIGWLSSFFPTSSQCPLAFLFLFVSTVAWIIFEKIVIKDSLNQE